MARNATTHVVTVLTMMFVTIPTVHVQRVVRLVTLTTTVKHVSRQSFINELNKKNDVRASFTSFDWLSKVLCIIGNISVMKRWYFPWEFSLIWIGCTSGTYGKNCNNVCGHCFGDEPCFHINGTCFAGCDSGYTGDLCKLRKYLAFLSFLTFYGQFHWLTCLHE